VTVEQCEGCEAWQETSRDSQKDLGIEIPPVQQQLSSGNTIKYVSVGVLLSKQEGGQESRQGRAGLAVQCAPSTIEVYGIT
jgi:hypothetical protein